MLKFNCIARLRSVGLRMQAGKIAACAPSLKDTYSYSCAIDEDADDHSDGGVGIFISQEQLVRPGQFGSTENRKRMIGTAMQTGCHYSLMATK